MAWLESPHSSVLIYFRTIEHLTESEAKPSRMFVPALTFTLVTLAVKTVRYPEGRRKDIVVRQLELFLI